MQLCSTSTTRNPSKTIFGSVRCLSVSVHKPTSDSEMLRRVVKILKYTVNIILYNKYVSNTVKISKVLNWMFTYTCYAMTCQTHSPPHVISPNYPICHVTSLRSWALRFSTVHSTGTKDLSGESLECSSTGKWQHKNWRFHWNIEIWESSHATQLQEKWKTHTFDHVRSKNHIWYSCIHC